MLTHVKRLGISLSLDHHSEGLLMGLVVLLVVWVNWWSVAGLGLYAIMQFQYCGSGAFRPSPRNNDIPAGIGDLLYVMAGMGGLTLMAAGMASRIVEVWR